MLAPWKKSCEILDSVLKSRDIPLLTKVHIVKVMVFPVIIYRCESWTIEKADCWRTDVFELWYWRRLLRIPWTVRRSNQLILKEINPWIFTGRTDAEAETPKLWPPNGKSGLIWKDLTPSLWCKEPTQWKRPCCWERLRAWGQGDDRGWDG